MNSIGGYAKNPPIQIEREKNYWVAYIFIAVGIVTSAAATIFVAAGTLPPEVNATLAAIPGIWVMILTTFKFEARSRWWWRKYFGLIKIQANLEHETNPTPEGDIVSRNKEEMVTFLLELSKEWPGFEYDRPPVGVPIQN